MLLTTTHQIEGRPIANYRGVVAGEAALAGSTFSDFTAAFSDLANAGARVYEPKLIKARQKALDEMAAAAAKLGADAVVGIDIDYLNMGDDNPLLMVAACGTAVVLG